MGLGNGPRPFMDLTVLKPHTTKKIAYFYDEEVANHYYREDHPMEPQRIKMAHSLVINTGTYKKLSIFRAKHVTPYEMKSFHGSEYVDFLQRLTPETRLLDPEECFGLDENDCPAFEGVFKYSAICAAGSLEGAARLGRNNSDIAINWAGGLHHAKKWSAAGFCYINDIVLGILELLRYYPRVLYIDIDVHHGDAVETAFWTSDRVMTASFHQYRPDTGFFPRTGSLGDIGRGNGRNFSVNFPLNLGIDDASYQNIFEPVIKEIITRFCPSVVVLQCGVDSLSHDKVGGFNLSMRGHANCVEFVKRLGIPTLVLGGGGYTIRDVARTWAYETGVLVGTDLQPSQLPVKDEYYQYYAPDYKLDVCAAMDRKNLNTFQCLEETKTKIFENLRNIAGPPSVQMQDVPRSSLAFWAEPDIEDARDDADEDEHPDVRYTTRRRDQKIQNSGELSETDDDEGPLSAYAIAQHGQKTRLALKRRNYHNHGEEIERANYDESGLKSREMISSSAEMEQKPGAEQPPYRILPSEIFPSSSSPTLSKKPWGRLQLDNPRCERCKTSKVGCDRVRPFCGTCVRRGRSHLCFYLRPDGTIGPDPGAATANALVEGIIAQRSPCRKKSRVFVE